MNDIHPTARTGRRHARVRTTVPVAAAAAALALVAGACGSSSSGRSASPTTAAAATSAGTQAAVTSASGTAQCTEQQCNVYSSVPWTQYKGVRVGILNLAPVPGATRWSDPLKSCLTTHGASVDYVDVGGDITKAAPTIRGWLTSGIKAIFDVGVPLAGEQTLLDQAHAQHIPVITWGAGNPPETVALDANQTVDGVQIAEYLVNKLGTSFSVELLSNSTNPALVSRMAGARAVFDQYPNIKVAYQQVPSFSVESAQQSATAVLQAHPNLGAIVGAYGDYGVGAANAVSRAGGKTIVVSMNGDPEEYTAIRSGGPLKATIADGHEAGSQLACETGAVMLGGGQPVGSHVFLSSTFVDSSNLPPVGQTDNSPRTVETLGS